MDNSKKVQNDTEEKFLPVAFRVTGKTKAETLELETEKCGGCLH